MAAEVDGSFMRLLIFGPQASGKGTYASRLSPILRIPHISTGDMFRENVKQGTELGKAAKDYMDRGELVPDDITIRMLKERLGQKDAQKGFILDGYPRNKIQAEALDKITKIDVIINLIVPENIIMTRIGARVQCRAAGHIFNLLTLKPKVEGKCDIDGSELYQRKDDTPKAIKERLELYNRQSRPLLEHYRKKGIVKDFEVRDLMTPPEVVVARILEALKGSRGK